MSSSQQAMPPPRSLAHEYQPLRGVMTISGGSAALTPLILAVTLNEVVPTRFTGAIRRTSVRRCACSLRKDDSSLDTCSTGGPKGRRKEMALLGQRPGRPPRVTHTRAL